MVQQAAPLTLESCLHWPHGEEEKYEAEPQRLLSVPSLKATHLRQGLNQDETKMLKSSTSTVTHVQYFPALSETLLPAPLEAAQIPGKKNPIHYLLPRMVQTLTHTTQNTHTKSTPEPKNNATTILIMPIQSVKSSSQEEKASKKYMGFCELRTGSQKEQKP